MHDNIGPSMHIDIRVVRNLLVSRINEGREQLKQAGLPNQWKKNEVACIEKLQAALKAIDEAVAAKEGNRNESTGNQNTNSHQETSGETGIQN